MKPVAKRKRGWFGLTVVLALLACAGVWAAAQMHSIRPRAGGKPVDTSLHEDAVLARWDSISSSLRARPSGPPSGPAPEPEPPATGLGTTARAGAVQYVRKGEPLPQALPPSPEAPDTMPAGPTTLA